MEASFSDRWREMVNAGDFPALQLELVKRLLSERPDDWYLLWFLGYGLRRFSKFDEAEAAFQRSLALAEPARVRVLLLELGHLCRDRGHVAAAEAWYRRAIQQNPGDAAGYIYLGAMLAKLGRLDEAEETHRQGTACTTGRVEESFYNLGLILRARERYAEAAAAFERALKIDPQYREAKLARRDVRRAVEVIAADSAALQSVPEPCRTLRGPYRDVRHEVTGP